jgi:hypothetical protein
MSKGVTLHMGAKSAAIILAALHILREAILEVGPPQEGSPTWKISTADGNFPVPTPSDIDQLCEALTNE